MPASTVAGLPSLSTTAAAPASSERRKRLGSALVVSTSTRVSVNAADDLLGGGQAVGARHRQVHQDDVRAGASHELHRLGAVTRLTDPLHVELAAQQRADRVAHQRVVVDHGDPDRAARRRHSPRSVLNGAVDTLEVMGALSGEQGRAGTSPTTWAHGDTPTPSGGVCEHCVGATAHPHPERRGVSRRQCRVTTAARRGRECPPRPPTPRRATPPASATISEIRRIPRCPSGPAAAGSKPTPSSTTSKVIFPSSWAMRMTTELASACRSALPSASRTAR